MKKVYPIKASVLMLAYNQRPYIDEAIRSVVLQDTTFDFELIVSDDASTDGTADRCLWWQQRYPDRIRVIRGDSNVGLAANFVRTYQAARGEYIAICEADDFWTDRHKLQIQVDFLDTHPDYSACFHRVINYYQADGSKSLSGGPTRRTVTLADLSLCNPITNVSVCYRHAVADFLPAWMDQVTSYDLVMHILCAEHGDIYYMRRIMAVYRKLETSIWTGGDKAKRAMISLKNRDLLIAYFQDRYPADGQRPQPHRHGALLRGTRHGRQGQGVQATGDSLPPRLDSRRLGPRAQEPGRGGTPPERPAQDAHSLPEKGV